MMKYLLLYFQKNWEMAILAATIILLLFIVLPFFVSGTTLDEIMGSGKAALKRESALSKNSFAFLDDGAPALELERDPFKLTVKAPEPPKPKPAPPKTEPKPVEKPKEPPKKAPAPEPEQPAKGPVRPQVVFQYVPGVIAFTFQQMNSTGKTVAIISAQSKGTQPQNYTVGVGEEVNGAIIQSISDETLIVQDAQKRRVAIPIGSKRQLWMRIKKE
ncbi:MAG: hypothetical protein IKP00_06930 [Victivallales bacterium]|nr:hypothetical protein [Victivallales bacterium]